MLANCGCFYSVRIMRLETIVSENLKLQEIVNLLHEAGGRCYLVGGCVRDAILNRQSHNIDLEVFNLTSQHIINVLSQKFNVDFVGKSYGILKIHGADIDIGVPRKERQIGESHRDFIIEEDPFLPIEEAISRRDFTINAIYYDFLAHNLIDPFGGIKDLNNKTLRHISDRFCEDPLRVLRGMQFCGRFNLTASNDTIELCKSLSPKHISAERIYHEFEKLLLQSDTPSYGLRFLKETNWTQYFPEIHNLIGVHQDPIRHPEGDVFNHVCCVLDVFAKNRPVAVNDQLIVGFSLLCHDFGKAMVTFQDETGIHSYGHEMAGVLIAQKFLEKLLVPKDILQQVLMFVRYHTEPRLLFHHKGDDSDFRKLSFQVRRMDLLTLISYCDSYKRVENYEEIRQWMVDTITRLNIESAPPKAIIQGRDLLQLGMEPSKAFSEILLKIYKAQLNGAFVDYDRGMQYTEKYLALKGYRFDDELS